jgi:hypothetical protein
MQLFFWFYFTVNKLQQQIKPKKNATQKISKIAFFLSNKSFEFNPKK